MLNCLCICEGSIWNPNYPTECNLFDRSMAAQPSVFSPSSILPPNHSHCAVLLARRNSARF